jgi:hypothetical protein
LEKSIFICQNKKPAHNSPRNPGDFALFRGCLCAANIGNGVTGIFCFKQELNQMELSKEILDNPSIYKLCLIAANSDMSYVSRYRALLILKQHLKEPEQKVVNGNIPSYDELLGIYEKSRQDYIDDKKPAFEYKAQRAGIRGIFEYLQKLNDKCRSCSCKHENPLIELLKSEIEKPF